MQKDFVSDANPKPLYKAGLANSLPQYVKDYTLPTQDEMCKFSSVAFADKHNRLHPINSKAATFLSGIYLHGTGKYNSAEMESVKQAASFYGIEEDLEAVIQELDSTNKKQASANASSTSKEDYAMRVEFEDEKTANFYPIGNEVQIRDSAVALNNHLMTGKIPSDWAYNAAVNIVKAAKEAGLRDIDLPNRVLNIGTPRLVDFEHAKLAAELRRYDLPSEDCVSLYLDVVKTAEENPEHVEDCIKLWSDLDMTHGIKYVKTFTPEEAFYAGERLDVIEKMASEVVVLRDVMIPADVVKNMEADKILTNFRKEASQTIQEAIKLAGVNPAEATKKLSELDEENQSELLSLLAKE